MTTLHHVKKARKAIKGTDIKKGDSYYWWQFAFRSKQVSKTRPRRSQYATQSEHLGNIYDIEDDLSGLTIDDIVDGFSLDDYTSQIQDVIDTCQERLDNMPEQLQEAPSGQTLQEYIDNCESWISDLESVDLEIDTYDDIEDEDERETALEERKQEILDNIQGCSYPG